MDHKEEYKKYKTISGWTEDAINALTEEQIKENNNANWVLKLELKDVHGKTSLIEQATIKICSLLLYNNIDYISQEEIEETAKKIIKLSTEKVFETTNELIDNKILKKFK